MMQGSAIRDSVVQGYFEIERFRERVPEGRQRAPRPELLPGMGPARIGLRGVAQAGVAQARSSSGVSTTPIPADQLRAIARGRPLDEGVRIAMETFFQTDFSAVRIHEGPAAARMGALAFTLGDDLHFAPGLYDPSSRDGVALLGHELTHVMQQREGRVANPYGDRVAIVQDPVLEAEADRMGQRLADELWSGARTPRGILRATRIGQRREERFRGGPAGAVQGKGKAFWSGKAPRPDLMPDGTRGAAVQGMGRAMARGGGARSGGPRSDMLPAAMRRSVVQGQGASASPVQVLQRMEMEREETTTTPTTPTPKDPWRHLDTATGHWDWPHSDNVKSAIQIKIARHIVDLLRLNHISARIGGSVAALGYSSTRVPDDIDIDILPKGKRLSEGEQELILARDLIGKSDVREFQFKTIDCWGIYQIENINPVSASQYVIALQINGNFFYNRHNPTSYVIEKHQGWLPIKLQLINETAFTHMNLPKDPGEVGVEKYKEVAGFSRLVANCIGRYLQNYPKDPKSDRERLVQMFRTKLFGAEPDKIKSICVKIAHYFPVDAEDPRNRFNRINPQALAVKLLGEIVHQLRPDIDAHKFSEAVLNAMYVSDLLKQLKLTGLLK